MYENNNYKVREITENEYQAAVDGGYHLDTGIPANYVLENTQTGAIEFYSSNLPNALNLCNRFNDAIQQEWKATDEGDNVVKMNH